LLKGLRTSFTSREKTDAGDGKKNLAVTPYKIRGWKELTPISPISA